MVTCGSTHAAVTDSPVWAPRLWPAAPRAHSRLPPGAQRVPRRLHAANRGQEGQAKIKTFPEEPRQSLVPTRGSRAVRSQGTASCARQAGCKAESPSCSPHHLWAAAGTLQTSPTPHRAGGCCSRHGSCLGGLWSAWAGSSGVTEPPPGQGTSLVTRGQRHWPRGW